MSRAVLTCPLAALIAAFSTVADAAPGASLGDALIVAQADGKGLAGPQLARGPGGDIVLAWSRNYSVEGTRTSDHCLRFFNADGTPRTAAKCSASPDEQGAISSVAYGDNGIVSLLQLASGKLTVLRVDRNGEPAADRVLVDTYPEFNSGPAADRPSIVSDGSGGFTVAWQPARLAKWQYGPSPSQAVTLGYIQTLLQSFAADGSPSTRQLFDLETRGVASWRGIGTALASKSDGGHVVLWSRTEARGKKQMQRRDSLPSGAPAGPRRAVSDTVPSILDRPHIIVLPDQRQLLQYTTQVINSEASSQLLLRRYTADGTAGDAYVANPHYDVVGSTTFAAAGDGTVALAFTGFVKGSDARTRNVVLTILDAQNAVVLPETPVSSGDVTLDGTVMQLGTQQDVFIAWVDSPAGSLKLQRFSLR